MLKTNSSRQTYVLFSVLSRFVQGGYCSGNKGFLIDVFAGPVGLCNVCLMEVTGRSDGAGERVADHRAVIQFRDVSLWWTNDFAGLINNTESFVLCFVQRKCWMRGWIQWVRCKPGLKCLCWYFKSSVCSAGGGAVVLFCTPSQHDLQTTGWCRSLFPDI